MRSRCLLAVAAVLIAACSESSQSPTSPGTEASFNRGHQQGPPPHVFYAKGNSRAKSSRVDMIWHNGAILTSVVAENIFWGPSWSNSGFVSDKITGLDTYLLGFGNSNYAKTCDEYTGTDGTVGPALMSNGHVIDLSTASGGGNTGAILAEVCKEIKSPVSNGIYNVYTDIPRGNAGYCAYHTAGSCGGVQVQFAFYWDLDGDAGCDPQDTRTVHSQGLEALANVTGHEMSEARTDPANGGWYDQQGNEDGDKCAWTFNVPYVTLSNASTWKIQGEWSNAAFNNGTGYPNLSGQRGCLDGH
jgi:hypothetical protein